VRFRADTMGHFMVTALGDGDGGRSWTSLCIDDLIAAENLTWYYGRPGNFPSAVTPLSAGGAP